MAELQRKTEIFRVETEQEAEELIKNAKATAAEQGYDLTKYETKYKDKKQKGEVIDQWYVVTLQKDF